MKKFALLLLFFIRVKAYCQIIPTGPIMLCAGQSVTLNAPVGGTSYKWYNNGTLVGTSMTYVANTTGNYTVAYTHSTIRDSLGPVVVTVQQNPIASFTSGASSNDCGNVPVRFTNTSAAGLQSSWNFGDPNSGSDNTSAKTNPIHSFIGNAGNGSQSYIVSLTVTNGFGCTNTATNSITLKQLPDTRLGGPGAAVINGKNYFRKCISAASVFTFSNLSTNSTNSAYTISWGDGSPNSTFATFTSVQHTYNIGEHTMQYIVTGVNGCRDTATYYVFVGKDPDIGLSCGASNICSGTAETFIIDTLLTNGNPPGTIYNASFNDGISLSFSQPPPSQLMHYFATSSCGAPPFQSYTNAFFASIVASNPCGVKNSVCIPIYVSDKPSANFNVSPNDSVGVNTVITLANTSLNTIVANGTCSKGNSVWTIPPSVTVTGFIGNDFGSNNPDVWNTGDDSISLQFSSPGVYVIRLKIGNNFCGIDSITKTIVVYPASFMFTGNGEWNIAANWGANGIPPLTLPIGCEIIISPSGSGVCVLNVSQTVSKGGKLTVGQGKKFKVNSNLKIE